MIVGLSIVSAVLFIFLIVALVYIAILKVEYFKNTYRQENRIESLEAKKSELDAIIDRGEDEIDRYSSALADSIAKLEELRHVIDQQNKTIDSFDEVSANISQFHDHIKAVGELQTYYGDQTIMELLDHSKFIVSYLEDFAGGVLFDEEKIKNERKYNKEDTAKVNEAGQSSNEKGPQEKKTR